MVQQLETVTLKNGEQVEAGVIYGPDRDWAPRILQMLSHKGDPWQWQNAQVLERDLGIDVFFYILHRDGTPFANIMTIELAGVGIFGHVWTNPEDRQKGASSRLMQLQMAHFRSRGGRALFLGTDFESVPYHLYGKQSFQGVEAGSGYMAYLAGSRETFATEYFRTDEAEVKQLNWSHWPASTALYLWDFPGVVRYAGAGLIGRQSTEASFLHLLNRAERYAKKERPAPALVLQSASTAVLGCAMWNWDPIWPDTCLVDVYCHPACWRQAGDLLGSLALPEAESYVAYADLSCPEQGETLMKAGFNPVGLLEKRAPVAKASAERADVCLFERRQQV